MHNDNALMNTVSSRENKGYIKKEEARSLIYSPCSEKWTFYGRQTKIENNSFVHDKRETAAHFDVETANARRQNWDFLKTTVQQANTIRVKIKHENIGPQNTKGVSFNSKIDRSRASFCGTEP